MSPPKYRLFIKDVDGEISEVVRRFTNKPPREGFWEYTGDLPHMAIVRYGGERYWVQDQDVLEKTTLKIHLDRDEAAADGVDEIVVSVPDAPEAVELLVGDSVVELDPGETLELSWRDPAVVSIGLGPNSSRRFAADPVVVRFI